MKVSSARVADHDVKPGVKADEGDGDEWPTLRKQVLDANILVLAMPIRMGQPSSIAKRVLGGSSACWVGEATGSVNYKDLKRTPKKLASTIKTLACNAARPAALLRDQPSPAPG